MPIVKCKQRDLQVGQFYLAYSAKSKMLSSNGNGGVIVQYVGMKEGHPEVKVWNKGLKTRNMTIRNMDARKDAFMVLADNELFKEIKVKIGDQGVGFAWPLYTERMQKACDDGVELKITSIMQPNDRFPEERVDGTMTFITETKNDNTTTYLNHFQVLVTTDMVAAVCSAEELKEREREEARQKVEKMKEGGVRLVVGKMEDGAKALPTLLKYREDLAEASAQFNNSTCSFTMLYGNNPLDITKHTNEYQGACHAGISYTKEGRDRQFVLTSVKKKGRGGYFDELSKEDQVLWIDYLINRSMYADLFVDKDAEQVYDLGYVVNCHAPSNVVSSALTATRHPWEYPMRAAAFSALRKYMDEHYAFFISLSAVGDIKKGELTSLKFTGGVSAHTCLDYSKMSDMSVLCMAYKAPDDKCLNEHLSGTKRSYSQPNRVHSIYGDTAGVKPNSLMKSLRSMKLDEVKTDNPFEMAKGDVERAIEFAVSCLATWREDNGDV